MYLRHLNIYFLVHTVTVILIQTGKIIKDCLQKNRPLDLMQKFSFQLINHYKSACLSESLEIIRIEQST
jgi:hypothetical protein